MLFALWARLQALYLSPRVVIVFALLLVAGYVLVLISRGILRATGLALLFLSAPELMRYYAYGANSNFAGITVAIVLMAAGVVCLIRAAARDTQPLTMSISKKAN